MFSYTGVKVRPVLTLELCISSVSFGTRFLTIALVDLKSSRIVINTIDVYKVRFDERRSNNS